MSAKTAVAAREGADLLYAPGERVFSLAAPLIMAMGWSVYPQERGGKRRPGRADGKTIQWGRLCDQAVGAEEFALWCKECSQLNVAGAFGPASASTFAVDIDCLNPVRSRSIQDLANAILGRTPFVRIGRAPKAGMIYRAPANLMPRSTSIRFVEDDGNASEDGMEILSKGKSLTLHGLHHVTGRWFQWPDANPLSSPPLDAPLVTPEMLEEFMKAVEAAHPVLATRSTANLMVAAGDWGQATDAGGLRVPLLGEGSVIGLATDAEGRVRDGREGWLKDIVFHVLTGNKALLLKSRNGEDEQSWRDFIAKAVRASGDLFSDTAVMDGKWRNKLEMETRQKVIHLAEKILAKPEDFPSQGSGGRVGFRLIAPVEKDTGDGELSWLRQSPRMAVRGWHEPRTSDSVPLPIQENRAPIALEVGNGIEHALDVFIDEANSGADEPGLHIIYATAGSGKTSRTLCRLATDPRTYLPDSSGRRRPYVMLLPTYGNIDELRLRSPVFNLDGTLDDEALTAQARAFGLIAEGEVLSHIEELRRDALGAASIALAAGDSRGFRTAVYSGKIRAGCAFPEKVELAMSAGIGASAFCRAIVHDDDGKREEICPYYDTCGAIRQRDLALDAHVVFMPHSFLALKLPDELLDVRAVIADERVHHLFLHVAELSVGTLKSARRPPRLTKAEQAMGIDAGDFMADRAKACGTALTALARGDCPAEALLALPSPSGRRMEGIFLVEAALRICGDGVRRDGSISPSTSFEAVRSYCTRPVGREIREELQFWRIVQERMKALVFDRELEPLARIAHAKAELDEMPEGVERVRAERALATLERLGSRARGKRDMRIQPVDASRDGDRIERIRISWRTRPNWDGVPTLLLDASAAPDIVAKIWGIPRERVVVHKVLDDFGSALNVRVVAVVDSTYSASSLAGRADSEPEERAIAAEKLSRVRDAISAVCAIHADARVYAGSSILIREALEDSWIPPQNLDWCHYGAMRGLDGMKFHGAAMSIGRMELPVRTIDGLVAGLTYDDPEPEEPFDIDGNGLLTDGDGEISTLRLPMTPRAIRMRDGSTAWLEIPCYPGRWASLMQKQYRDEEVLQLLGRLRPVYRSGRPPVWYALSSAMPEGIVVDDIMHIDDMLGGVPRGPLLWNAARRCGGILSPRLAVLRCPDLFPTVEAASEAMRTAGLAVGDSAEQSPPLISRASRRAWSAWRPWQADAEDGQDSEHALVAPWAEATLATQLSDVIYRPQVRTSMAALPVDTFLAMAKPRLPDAVEQRLGNHAQRGVAENAIVAEVSMQALQGGMDVAGRIEWGGRMLTPAQACAARSLANAWRRRAMPQPRPILREGEDTTSWEDIAAGTMPAQSWTA